MNFGKKTSKNRVFKKCLKVNKYKDKRSFYAIVAKRMKNFENFLNFFQKAIAIWKVIGYNKYIKVVKSGVTVDKSGAKGGLKDALR
jgi:hypothetical protein